MKYDYPLFKSKLKTSKYNVDILVRNLFPDIDSRYPDKVHKNMIKVVCNLIRYESIAIPRGNDWFTSLQHPYISRTYLRKALKILINRGYIKILNNGYKTTGFETGFVTIYERTAMFNEIFMNRPVTEMNKEITIEVEEQEVKEVYKDSKKSKYNKISEGIKEYYLYNIGHFKPLDERVLKTLNTDYLSKITLSHKKTNKLDIFTNIVLSRIPTIRNNNEVCGCRFYQTGGESYLQMSGKDEYINRTDLFINGKETIELDYECQHINLLYNIGGIKSPYEDNYVAVLNELNITSKELRKIIKIIMLRLINAMTYGKFKISFNRKLEDRLMVKLLKVNNLDLDIVTDAIKKVHPNIAKFIGNDAGVYLQRHDSNIMENVLYRMYKENILGIPIHDSVRFIKTSYNISTVKKIMKEEYEKYTGFSIGVTI